jgi:hypothetical protein
MQRAGKRAGFTFFIKPAMKTECLLAEWMNNCALQHALQFPYKNFKRFLVLTSYKMYTVA